MVKITNKKYFFTKKLLEWHISHPRSLPWKGERDPYLVWLSEIILQQTRVEQGLPYFERFKEKYPTVGDLAQASEDEVLKMWEGLGYYSRARNLHFTARFVAAELGGKFPATYLGLRSLRGIGDYTAAAIASFALGLPYAVVDGNVQRVLSRYFGIEEPVDTAKGKRLIAQLAQELLDEAQPGNYNQAIMDFGATHCTPATPKCTTCPLQVLCKAFQQKKVESFPLKSKKSQRRQRFFCYLVIHQQGKIFIKKRTKRDIWQNLYDFPMIEMEHLPQSRQAVLGHETCKRWLGQGKHQLLRISLPFKQELSHQQVTALFCEIKVGSQFCPPQENWLAANMHELNNFAFPKLVSLYFKQNILPLELL